ncbi:uncharacterized protein LOC125047858 [Penaeus chinensis]|uniref:uncharacterized protein LOC125047858 n=1 Tax=Penaeus chinensis TaxID=139456 RepID=UPI001FB74E05|nr:uncharacterized protein LOC125047858 [Penaeus chinensis]
MAGPGPSCGLCGKLYTKTDRRPRSLLCGHTFCTLCLEEAIRAKSCNCPSCSHPFIAFSAAQLPTDFSVLQKITSSSSNAPYDSFSWKSSRDKTSADEPDAFRSAFSRLSSTRYGDYSRDIASGDTASQKTPDKEEGTTRSSRWPKTQELPSRRRYTDHKVYSEESADESDSSGDEEKDLSSGVSKYRMNASSCDHKPLSRTNYLRNPHQTNTQPDGSYALSRMSASSTKSSLDATSSTLKNHDDEEFGQEPIDLTPFTGPRARRPSSDRANWKLLPRLEVDTPKSIPESPGNTSSTPKHVLRMCRSLTNKHLTSGRDSDQMRQRTPTAGESTDDEAADTLGPPPPLPGTGPPALSTDSAASDHRYSHESVIPGTEHYEKELPTDTTAREKGSTHNRNELHQTLKKSEYDKNRDNEVQTSVEAWPKSDNSRSLRTRLSRRALSLQYALDDDESVKGEAQYTTESASFHSPSSLSSSATTTSKDLSKENTRKPDLRRYRSLGNVEDKLETKTKETEACDISRSLSRSHSAKQDAGDERSKTPAQSKRQGYENLRIKSDWKYSALEEGKRDKTYAKKQEDKENIHWSKRRLKLSGRSTSVDESHKKDATASATQAKLDNIWSKYPLAKPKEASDSFSQEHKMTGFSQNESEHRTDNISSSISSSNKEDENAKVSSVRDWKIPRKLEYEDQKGMKTETTDTSSLKTTVDSRPSGRKDDLPNSFTDRLPMGLLRIGIVPSVQTVSEESEQTDDTKDEDTVDAPQMSKAGLSHLTSRGSDTLVPKNKEVFASVTSKRQQESFPGNDEATSNTHYSTGETNTRNRYDGKQMHFEACSLNTSSDDADIHGNFRHRNRYQEIKRRTNLHNQKNVESDDGPEDTDEKHRRSPKVHHKETNETSKHKRDHSNQNRADKVAKGLQSSEELNLQTKPPPAEVLQKLPDTGLCQTHGSIVHLYCQRCEMWICEECLDMLHSPPPAGLCHVMSMSEALLGLKEKHSEFFTSRINTLNHFRRDLKKLLFECENSVEEHEATILELQAKMEEEKRLIEGMETMKALVLEKAKQIDSWEDLLQKNANRIEKSGTSHDMIHAVERNKAEILRRFRENEELEIAM